MCLRDLPDQQADHQPGFNLQKAMRLLHTARDLLTGGSRTFYTPGLLCSVALLLPPSGPRPASPGPGPGTANLHSALSESTSRDLQEAHQ